MRDGESPAESDDGGGEAAAGAASLEGEAEVNPDLFYRMKLKLWDRDRVTGMIRTPFDKLPTEDKSHWGVGTRIIITEPGDMYHNFAGRILEYRGRNQYSVMMEDGHKVSYAPLQFHRCATQLGPPERSVMLEGAGALLLPSGGVGSHRGGGKHAYKEGHRDKEGHPRKGGRSGGLDE
ncbi:hypothetical protein T484DRAFT_2025006, partial [Baffinella frigidus]